MFSRLGALFHQLREYWGLEIEVIELPDFLKEEKERVLTYRALYENALRKYLNAEQEWIEITKCDVKALRPSKEGILYSESERTDDAMGNVRTKRRRGNRYRDIFGGNLG